MGKCQIANDEIKTLVEERNRHNENEYLVIEDKLVSSFYNVEAKNIIFKNCVFSVDDSDKLFSNSVLENIILEDCVWSDSLVRNAMFKNLVLRRTIIYNNTGIVDCVFDNLQYINSLMCCFGFGNCEIKNTDFRGCESFFLQAYSLEYIYKLFEQKKLDGLYRIASMERDEFFIPWYNIKYTNCVIDLDGIKRLTSYSDKIDSNYSELAYASYRTGFINLENVDLVTRYNLIAGIFLYNVDQEYDYLGEFSSEEYSQYFRNTRKKHIPPMFFYDDHIDLSKYKKTLSTKPNKYSMRIVDGEGKDINYSLIVPLGDITFTNSFYKDSSFVESHFDATLFGKNSFGEDKVYQKKLWQK